ncbi:MAG: hypothetical protein GY866_06380 [Proteobacteria bacterium]|nr:hypothetical protein [Pseudomonadota bacterium]
MITFTVPEEIRSTIRRNQNDAYKALFTASSQALKKLAANERFVGTNLPGFTGVLHTWGRQLRHHPHIHCIVADGGLEKGLSRQLPGRWRRGSLDSLPRSVCFSSRDLQQPHRQSRRPFRLFQLPEQGSRQNKTMRLEAMEFMRRFLQHVLPSGFMKVRQYGFMNPSCGISRERIVELIETRTGESLPVVKPPVLP